MARCLPASLTIPLLVLVCGEGTLPEEQEAWLREALPRGRGGEQLLSPWAVFVAEGLQQASEALGQGLQWLVQHGPAQPELQVIGARCCETWAAMTQ